MGDARSSRWLPHLLLPVNRLRALEPLLNAIDGKLVLQSTRHPHKQVKRRGGQRSGLRLPGLQDRRVYGDCISLPVLLKRLVRTV